MSNETKDFSGRSLPNSAEGFSPLSAARMLWRRKYTALAIWSIISLISCVWVLRLPPVYMAEALILVDPQKIPESFVNPTVNEEVTDRLALINQEVMSRTQLLQIIREFGLYQKVRPTMTEEELVARMNHDISVTVQKNWSGGKMAAFRLAFEGSNPVVITKVANRLAGLYIAENARSRETQAAGTVEFLDSKLDDAKKSLDAQEAKVSAFKQMHSGELPQQENSILSELNSLQVQLQGCQDAITRATDERMNLEASLSAAETSESALERSLQPRSRGTGTVVMESGVPPKLRSEILEAKLHELELRFTPDHPDVQAVKREIAVAKQQEAQEADESVRAAAKRAQEASSATNRNGTTSYSQDPTVVTPEVLRERERIVTLRAQMASIANDISLRTKQRGEILSQMASYQARIIKLPLVEQQMAALTRDYQISQDNYKSLLDKKLAAGLATDMEHSQKSERFKIVDLAHTPEKPVRPKRLLLASGGCLLGLALGLGVALAIEFHLGLLMGEWELPRGVIVLGRVPLIKMPAKVVPVQGKLLLAVVGLGSLVPWIALSRFLSGH
jgi:succinoglycan biosynthesis transport protein ExoP